MIHIYRNFRILFIVIASVFLFSCATAPVEEKPLEALPPEEQEEQAMETLKSMLELTARAPRKEVRPHLEEGYKKIIREYPDTYLAEESYLRLILFNLEEYDVPRVAEAERLYREYFEKYPEPKIGKAINEYMARFYYDFRQWEKLAVFSTPFVKQSAKTGNYSTTIYLLFYSEAKFHMKDYDEAERGYNLMLKVFPRSYEAGLAERRLEEINRRRDN